MKRCLNDGSRAELTPSKVTGSLFKRAQASMSIAVLGRLADT